MLHLVLEHDPAAEDQRVLEQGFLAAQAERGGLSLPAYPHMLRHACGYALADQGADTRPIQDCLGHRNIQHAARYTAANPARFERLWG